MRMRIINNKIRYICHRVLYHDLHENEDNKQQNDGLRYICHYVLNHDFDKNEDNNEKVDGLWYIHYSSIHS